MESLAFSCTSFSFPKLSLSKAAQVIAAIGFSNIDLCVAEGERDVDVRRVLSDPRRAADEDRSVCEGVGLGVQDIFCILGRDRYDRPINTPDAAKRQEARTRFAAVVLYAVGVGAKGITILPGFKWPQFGDRGFSLACEELTWYVDRAGEAGLRLGVEPHVESIIPTPESAAEMAQRVSGLQLTLDYSHFLVSGFEQQQVHPLARYAGHVHARQAAPGRLQVGSRDGVLRFDEILDNLRRAQYRGAVAVEYVWAPWRNLDQIDIVSETVLLFQQLRDFAATALV